MKKIKKRKLNAVAKTIFNLSKLQKTKNVNELKPFWHKKSKKWTKFLWKNKPRNSKRLSGFPVVKNGNTSYDEAWIGKKKPNKKWESIVDELLDKLRNNKSEIEKYNSCRKIRIYPNQEQIILFNKCFNATRYFYNECVAYGNKQYSDRCTELELLAKNGCVHFNSDKSELNNADKKQCKKQLDENNKYFCISHNKEKVKWNIEISHITLRNKLMVSDKHLSENDKWQAEIPYDTRQLAIKSYAGSIKSSLALKKKGLISNFKMSFKSKRDTSQVFYVNKRAISSDLRIFKRRLKKRNRIHRKIKRENKIEANRDFTVLRTEPHKYYICIPIINKTKEENASGSVVSLDPGVRTFQTFYSPDGQCGKLGDNTFQRIMKLSKKIDELCSVRDLRKKLKSKMQNVNRRCNLLRIKIKNIVNDLHWKSAAFLCKNYHMILIPSFQTSDMTKKDGRSIHKTTARSMLALSHYKFRERLTYKASCYSNRKVVIVNESYTSKTCGSCGEINGNLGSSKIFKCNKCEFICDRDINGARNVFLKLLSDHINRKK